MKGQMEQTMKSTIKPYLGPFPAPRVIVSDRPDLCDPLNQFTVVGIKWYEATTAGFAIKAKRPLTAREVAEIEKDWMARLPDLVLRNRKRGRWMKWPIIRWFIAKAQSRDYADTFRLP
jgi:hypothetical protein